MRHHDATMAGRWRKRVLAECLVLSVLAVVGLPESHAQMRYSGGFIPTRRNPPQFPTPQPSDSKTTAPKTPPSYFPDNDAAYPSFYPGGQARRPLPAAGQAPYRVLPADLPWNRADFEDYNEPPTLPRDASVIQPKKYLLTAMPLLPAPAAEPFENAILIAHLPEHAVLWVEGTRTRSMGRTRYFQSPPLLPGRKYNYRVSAAWIEDGRWVSQTRMVLVQAGLIQAIYLRPAPVIPAEAAMNSLPR
jgi:uncharacterized protein (TIGR03000 family)